MRLSSHSQVPPPPHFRYRHPVSGAEFTRHAWDLLRSDVTVHTEGNGFPPVSDEEIEAQMCENMGEEIKSRFCLGDGLTVRGGFHWRELLSGTQALANHLLNGRKVVEQSEADRRAVICAACPRNSHFSKPCGGNCPELESIVQAVVGGGKTALDDKLQACSVCGCVLRALVWVPGAQLSTSSDADFIEKAPETCWKRAELLQNRAQL